MSRKHVHLIILAATMGLCGNGIDHSSGAEVPTSASRNSIADAIAFLRLDGSEARLVAHHYSLDAERQYQAMPEGDDQPRRKADHLQLQHERPRWPGSGDRGTTFAKQLHGHIDCEFARVAFVQKQTRNKAFILHQLALSDLRIHAPRVRSGHLPARAGIPSFRPGGRTLMSAPLIPSHLPLEQVARLTLRTRPRKDKYGNVVEGDAIIIDPGPPEREIEPDPPPKKV